MNMGRMFQSAWQSATDVSKAAATGLATGAEKIGAAAVKGVEVAAGAAVGGAAWAAQETKKVGQAAVALAKDTGSAVKSVAALAGQKLASAANSFVDAATDVVNYVKCGHGDTKQATQQITQLLERLPPGDASKLSELAYTGQKNDQAGAWTVKEVITHPGMPGYRAILAEGPDGRMALSYSGTYIPGKADLSLGNVLRAGSNLKTDAVQELGGIPPDYAQALIDAQTMKDRYGSNLVLTGHSLGGGEANFASEMLGIPAVTVNPAPLGVGARAAIALAGAPNHGDNSVAISNRNDFVSIGGQVNPLASQPGHVLLVDSSQNPFSQHSLGNVDMSSVDKTLGVEDLQPDQYVPTKSTEMPDTGI